MKKIATKIRQLFKDELFLSGLHQVENLIAKILSIALIIVILVTLFDLVIILFKDLIATESTGFFSKPLLEIFEMFLNILIALELLENITAYLNKHIVQVELVVVTALMAVARQIIIFDPKPDDKIALIALIALAIASLALSTSYWLIRRMNQRRP